MLFDIGSDFGTQHPDKPILLRRVGYATAEVIEGPWTRCNKPLIEEESNNPAVLVETDGSILLMYRDADLKISIARSPALHSPFEIIRRDIFPAAKLEDFYLFKKDGKYRCILEDNIGFVTGHVRWGADLVSDNGLDDWHAYDPVIAYDHDIPYTDGSVLHCVRRERPQLFIEAGKVLGLLTGVYDGDNTWCQPVALEPGY